MCEARQGSRDLCGVRYVKGVVAPVHGTVEPLYSGHHWEPTFCLL